MEYLVRMAKHHPLPRDSQMDDSVWGDLFEN